VKTSHLKRPYPRARSTVALQAGALTATASAVLMLASGVAQAQQATQTITVTGIRGAIESAISVKKNSDSIIESINAEDIGKLPDTSIAESIARLPGVAAQRAEGGRASAISVRGFAPDFSTALLNGREQVSTGDSRYVEYDQYPSELLNGVDLYKTPDGALIGQGLSATLDMRTIRPLDLPSRKAAVNYRREQLGKGLSTPSGSGSRFNIAYIDQFADRTLGLALSYAKLDETTGTSQNFSSWGVNDVCPVANNEGCPQPTLGKAPGGFNDLVDRTKQTREALMATLQYKPSKSFSSTLDVFTSKFDQNKLEQGAQIPLAPAFPEWGQNYGGTAVTPITVTNGVITDGSIAGFKAVSRNDVDATHDKVHSIGWANQLTVGDWVAKLDLSTSEAKRNAPHLETTAGLAGNCKANPSLCGTVSWTGFDGNNVTSAKYTYPINLGDTGVVKLTDVEGWGGNLTNGASTTPQAGYSKVASTDDKLNAYRLSGKHDLPEGFFFADVDLGLNYADRKKDRSYVEGRLILSQTDPFAAVAVPGGTSAVGPQTGTSYVAWNPDGSIGSIYTIASKLQKDIANKNWTVTEKVTTAYAKFGIDNKLFGLPVRGNAGLQLVHTQQDSRAYSVDGQACPGDVCPLSSYSQGTSYYDVLPSVNLNSDIGNGQVVRLGLGRQMARPTLNDMRASLEFSVNQGIYSGSGGNPQLKPYRANTLDLSYEKYWGTKAYVSVAGFYKQLSTYIIKSPGLFDFAPYITPGTPSASSNIGLMTRPVNGSGGRVSGMELAASLPLNFATDMLDGFGVQASYSYTDSSVKLPITGLDTTNILTLNIPLPGLSRNVAGLTFYYEKAGFEARIGSRYRSNFIGNITDQFGDNRLVFIKGERITDVQLSYNFESGPAKGLSVLLQANNISDTPYIEFKDEPSNISKKVNYGKTYLFGLNYKM
jgi:iron complex outermembrane receptor protein